MLQRLGPGGRQVRRERGGRPPGPPSPWIRPCTLQRVMNAAARVVSDARKFDHGLTQILHDDLHRLDVADRVTYKLGVIMHRCRHGKAPQ